MMNETMTALTAALAARDELDRAVDAYGYARCPHLSNEQLDAARAARRKLDAAIAAALADAEARGRAAALAEVDAAVVLLAQVHDQDWWRVDRVHGWGGWCSESCLRNGRSVEGDTPTAAILSAVAAQ